MPAKKQPDRQPGADPAPADATPTLEPPEAPEPVANGSAAEPDLKARFREALDRKHGLQADSGGSEGRSGGKGGGRTHGPARTQRTFRRKSG